MFIDINIVRCRMYQTYLYKKIKRYIFIVVVGILKQQQQQQQSIHCVCVTGNVFCLS